MGHGAEVHIELTEKRCGMKLPLTGTDQREIALLRHTAGAETAGHWGYVELAPYIAAARQIIQSKNAFDGASDTLSVEGYVAAE